MWIEQKTATWRKSVPNHPEFEQWRLRVLLLRARMLAFVQQILAFVTFEVLEPNWRSLETKLANVTTVDQLLKDHVDFLDTCLKECMLTSAKLLRVSELELGDVPADRTSYSTGILEDDRDMLDVCTLFVIVYKISLSGALGC